MILKASKNLAINVKAEYMYSFEEHPWSHSPGVALPEVTDNASPEVMHVQFMNVCNENKASVEEEIFGYPVHIILCLQLSYTILMEQLYTFVENFIH